MDVSVARHINDQRGWFVISDELFDYYDQDAEYDIAKAYRCFHCGILVKEAQVVVHKASCMIGADERLNKTLFMLEYCFNTANTNDGLGARVFSDVSDFIRGYK